MSNFELVESIRCREETINCPHIRVKTGTVQLNQKLILFQTGNIIIMYLK